MIIKRNIYSPLRGHSLVVALAISTLAQALADDTTGAGLAQPTTHKQSSTQANVNLDNIQLEKLKRSRDKDKKVNAFPAKSWYVPPPAPPPTPPPAPSAPPLPYTFIGKFLEPQGKLTIFLTNGDKVHLVSAGETIDNTYSVDGVENGKLTLTYLPLKIKQYINLGETP